MTRFAQIWPLDGTGAGQAAAGAGACEPTEVHLWRIALDVTAGLEDRLRAELSVSETERMQRFRFARHRRRYTVRAVATRRILGRYLGTDPQDVAFDVGTWGKPAIAGDGAGLDFNRSDSHERALLAIGRGGPVGVDIERVDPGRDPERLAGSVFTDAERAQLETLGGGDRVRGFFRAWAAKEATIKLDGRGMSWDLQTLSLVLAVDGDVRELRVVGDSADRSTRVLVFDDLEYACALAAGRHVTRVDVADWDPTTT